MAVTGSHPSAIANTTSSTIPDTNSGITVSIDWPTTLIVRSIGFPTFSADTIPPMIPSGTTMMNAKHRELQRAAERAGQDRPDRRSGTGTTCPGSGVIQCQYWVRSGLSTPS